MNFVEKTIDLHRNGGLNCSQAIMTAFGERCGMSPEAAKVLGRPWAGGMARLGGTCGYLTGAILVLAQALRGGKEAENRKELFRMVQELFTRFEERRGTTLCKELLGADISTKEGYKKIQEERITKKLCCGDYSIGKDVAEILEDLISAMPS